MKIPVLRYPPFSHDPRMQAARPAFDFRAITGIIESSLATAGLGSQAGLMKQITGTVERALASAGLVQGVEGHAPLQPEAPYPGRFLAESFTNAAGTRAYRLYVPAGYAADGLDRVPLVLMLHGCRQTPEDFAAGTRMNALAEAHGFLVAYPGQPAAANGSSCWNWFLPEDQARGCGEPSLLAGIAGQVSAGYRVDPRRIFVAGMSAGGAMAVVLATVYPELFAAVGVHSGLPYGSAQDVPSAFGVMKNGGAGRSALAVPAIVFHGSADATVVARNGAAVVEQALRRHAGALHTEVREEPSVNGRECRTTVYRDASGRGVVEHWVVGGGAHAWSGGSPEGTFTDAAGPDASAEMVRFFLAQPAAGTA